MGMPARVHSHGYVNSDQVLRVPARPWALTLPFNSQDIGTSRWQLAIERYTNFQCLRKGGVMAGIGPVQAPPRQPRRPVGGEHL
jgi:hypothetical protein